METTAPVLESNELSIVDALWTLIKGQTKSVRKALADRLMEDEVTNSQETMVKQSLCQAFDELYSGQIKHNARNLFAK